MTLILSIVSTAFVLQASDRQVTASSGERMSAYDDKANKAILYRAKDGIAAIGYSGLAYVDQMPTDEWVAEVLWGEPIPRAFDHSGPVAWTGQLCQNRWWPIGFALKALECRINGLSQRLIDQGGIEVLVSGWRRTRGRPDPFVIGIKRRCKWPKASIMESPRPLPTGVAIGAIGARDSEHIMAAFSKLMAENEGKNHVTNEVDAKDFLVLNIREISQSDMTVGPHVQTLYLPRQGLIPVSVRFHPAAPHSITTNLGANTFGPTEVAYSPWLVGPTFIASPQVNVGTLEYDLGGIRVLLEGATPTGNLVYLVSSTPPKGPPR